MIPAPCMKIFAVSRRISVLVLLFTFCGMSLHAQKPDTLQTVIDETELIPLKPGQDTLRRAPLQPVSREVQDTTTRFVIPDTIQGMDAVVTADTSRVNLEDIEHSPRKAMIYAIALPGLGQAYNKKYWKIPIVYAALAGAAYAIYYNNGQYKASLAEYALDPNNSTTERYLKYWRRNLEISIISVFAVDALAVVDAYVDAHLFHWDVNPDLTIKMEPDIQPLLNPGGSFKHTYGLRASITF